MFIVASGFLERASKPDLDIAAAGQAYDHEVRMSLPSVLQGQAQRGRLEAPRKQAPGGHTLIYYAATTQHRLQKLLHQLLSAFVTRESRLRV